MTSKKEQERLRDVWRAEDPGGFAEFEAARLAHPAARARSSLHHVRLPSDGRCVSCGSEPVGAATAETTVPATALDGEQITPTDAAEGVQADAVRASVRSGLCRGAEGGRS